MTEITISALTAADVNAVNKVGREAYGVEPSQAGLAEAIRGDGFSRTLVARAPDAEVLGFVMWETFGADNAYVGNLSVSPQFHNRKIGRRLMERAFARMVEEGYRTASLNVSSTNESALALYSALGFKQHGSYSGCMVKPL